jgi:hypothetical protein
MKTSADLLMKIGSFFKVCKTRSEYKIYFADPAVRRGFLVGVLRIEI